MKELIQHLLRNNIGEIVGRSLLNCHVKGLHSIMLLECPQKTIRIYVTDEDHDLHSNFGSLGSLAFHPHHCNLTLHCIKGRIFNWKVKAHGGKANNSSFPVKKWVYKSAISGGGEMKFYPLDSSWPWHLETVEVIEMKAGDSIHMEANELHTVAAFRGVHAWFCYEGIEDWRYQSIAYSNNILSQLDSTGLYQKAKEEDVMRLLKQADLI